MYIGIHTRSSSKISMGSPLLEHRRRQAAFFSLNIFGPMTLFLLHKQCILFDYIRLYLTIFDYIRLYRLYSTIFDYIQL
jgi:hypothetical protein